MVGLYGGSSVPEETEEIPKEGFVREDMDGLPVGGSAHEDTEGTVEGNPQKRRDRDTHLGPSGGGQMGPTGHFYFPPLTPPPPLGVGGLIGASVVRH